MGKLRKSNLVRSQKGKSGGYTLVKKPSDTKVGEIIEVLEGPLVPMKCSLCEIEERCSSSFVWLKLGKEIKKTLDRIRLSELI